MICSLEASSAPLQALQLYQPEKKLYIVLDILCLRLTLLFTETSTGDNIERWRSRENTNTQSTRNGACVFAVLAVVLIV